jgi:hypothetical protein
MSHDTRKTERSFMGAPQPAKNAETNSGSAPALDVNKRGLGRVAVNSGLLIAVLAGVLTLQDSHARPVAKAVLAEGARRAAIASVVVVHPSLGVASLTIPSNTLLFREEGLRVGVVRDGLVQLVPISIGDDYGDTVEVTAGLSSKDEVVLNPSASLLSGTRVEIDPNTAAKATE